MPDPFLFPHTLAGLDTISAVCAELLRHTAPLGFTVHAIGAVPHPDLPYPEDFIVANWPEAWNEAYFARRFGERDPVLRVAMMQAGPFSTEDLRRGLIGPLSPAETEVLDFAATLGLPHGFITPVHGANGYRGLACLIGPGPDPAPRERALMQYLMVHAHDRLRLLSAHKATDAISLTTREVHVLSLSRKGLTDSQIAQEAGITARTVRFHFENARHKLGARNRAEALSLAIARHLLPQ